MSDEFRGIHQASQLLAQYKKSRDLELIRSVPISDIKRFDVWQSVFEEEPEAFRELEIKKMYETFGRNHYHGDDESTRKICRRMAMTLAVTFIDRKIEYPKHAHLSIEDLLRIVVDVFGVEILDDLRTEAKEHVAQREEIIKPYFEKDNTWVQYAKDGMAKIEKFKLTITEVIDTVSV